MSTPGNEFREAEYLGIGFLAISSSELIEKLLEGHQIDDDDKYVLRRAETFLNDVSSGARLVTSGGLNANVSAADSVRKLAYSVEPLKLMQDGIQSAEVGDVFQNMALSIEAALTNHIDEITENNLCAAKEFFHQLHVFIMSLIETHQNRTGIDADLGMPMFA
ncbi:hypothetical protein [Thiohalobacter thiocyanaticus]|uniref:hypothetical protein n=1 Tax=Thiohalobacter thiocyanaticus TaxID=585455 RepID=UPI000F62C526|nr:hypothetical protein [Thiohalobacter thiocyanaticus]